MPDAPETKSRILIDRYSGDMEVYRYWPFTGNRRNFQIIVDPSDSFTITATVGDSPAVYSFYVYAGEESYGASTSEGEVIECYTSVSIHNLLSEKEVEVSVK